MCHSSSSQQSSRTLAPGGTQSWLDVIPLPDAGIQQPTPVVQSPPGAQQPTLPLKMEQQVKPAGQQVAFEPLGQQTGLTAGQQAAFEPGEQQIFGAALSQQSMPLPVSQHAPVQQSLLLLQATPPFLQVTQVPFWQIRPGQHRFFLLLHP